MKVRVVAISEESLDAPGNATATAAAKSEASKPIVVARLATAEIPVYHWITVPYEMIAPAFVGDEFMLHLERVPSKA